MKSRAILIACRIFEEELTHVLRGDDQLAGPEVIWIDAGLHSDLALLEKELTTAIDRAKALGGREVKLFFGHGCLPGLTELAAERGVALSPMKNCISAFLSEDEIARIEQSKAMIMTPSWVRAWPDNMRRISGWDEVDFRLNLGRYERIVVLDPGINPLGDEEIMAFFDLTQVVIDVESIDLARFEETLGALLG
ncbi:DUF1638 domain-containing protein [Desulfarculus baarsii]